MTCLKVAMKGEAAGVLNSYPTTAVSYDSTVETLKKRFGKKQTFIRCHVKDLLSSGKIEPNAKLLSNFLDNMKSNFG